MTENFGNAKLLGKCHFKRLARWPPLKGATCVDPQPNNLGWQSLKGYLPDIACGPGKPARRAAGTAEGKGAASETVNSEEVGFGC